MFLRKTSSRSRKAYVEGAARQGGRRSRSRFPTSRSPISRSGKSVRPSAMPSRRWGTGCGKSYPGGHRRKGVPGGGTDRLRRPGPPAGSRGDRLRHHAGARRSRGAGRPRGAERMVATFPRGPGGGPVPRRFRRAPAERGARGMAGARSREELAGGGRRRGRSHRLPGILRPGDDPAGQGRPVGRLPRGRESLPVPSAGRGPRHRAVEFPTRHLGRDGFRGAGRRERRPLQAVEPLPGQRVARVLPAAGRRSARRRSEFHPRKG